MAHYVYAIAMLGDNPILSSALKIGIAHNPTLRLSNMQTGSPFELAIKHTWQFKTHADAREFEQACHSEFKDRNILREWFRVTVAEINEFHDAFFSVQDIDKEASDLIRALRESDGLDVRSLAAMPKMCKADGDGTMSTKEAAAYIGKSPSWLNKSRMTGTGPVYLKLGGGVRYSVEDLQNWLIKNRRTAIYDHANSKAA